LPARTLRFGADACRYFIVILKSYSYAAVFSLAGATALAILGSYVVTGKSIQIGGSARTTDYYVTALAPLAPVVLENELRVAADSTEGLLARLRASKRDDAQVEQLLNLVEQRLNENNAADIFRALPEELQESELGITALMLWSERAPFAVIKWFAARTVPTERQLGPAVRQLFAVDAVCLRDYIGTLADGDWKQRLLGVAATSAVANHQIEDAAGWLKQTEPSRRSRELLGSLALEWGRQDFATAAYWAADQTDPSLQEFLLGNVALGHSGVRPQEAVYLACGMLKSSEKIVATIVSQWAERSITDASAAIVGMPEGAVRAEAIRALLDIWTDYDPSGAQAWIARLPESELKRQAANAGMGS
jgi:hypothetical protein